jgi:hypothetical protein
MSNSNAGDTDSLEVDQAVEVEKTPSVASNNENNDMTAVDTPEFLSGVQLSMLVFGVSLAGFLYSLDTTVMVTVSPYFYYS